MNFNINMAILKKDRVINNLLEKATKTQNHLTIIALTEAFNHRVGYELRVTKKQMAKFVEERALKVI